MSPSSISGRQSPPIGVVLAGGRGRRLGGGKAVAQLCGRPMISYPLAALEAVLAEVVVVAKAETELPSLPSHTRLWSESESLQHPLIGLRTALELAAGTTVLVCAVDLPCKPGARQAPGLGPAGVRAGRCREPGGRDPAATGALQRPCA